VAGSQNNVTRPGLDRWRGHLWTILPSVGHLVRPLPAPAWRPWHTSVLDEGRAIRVSGRLRERPGADAIVVVIHGLGGNSDSHYCIRGARAVDARGWSCLRLALRGADGEADDFYHAGLTTDLRAALASSEVAAHRRILVLGYSLGGHVALHLACDPGEPRLTAVAAVCPPLDLTLGARVLDGRGSWLYRRHILAGLNAAYARIAARAPVPTPAPRVRQAAGIREWDTLTVVPRFGFADADDYYRRMSVGPRLRRVVQPALLVHSRHDPVIPAWTVTPSLAEASPLAESWWIEDGGHVGFPSRLSIAGRGPRPLEEHVLDWMDRSASRPTLPATERAP
jgi:predicted alpha/beta-fold hydrolase